MKDDRRENEIRETDCFQSIDYRKDNYKEIKVKKDENMYMNELSFTQLYNIQCN